MTSTRFYSACGAERRTSLAVELVDLAVGNLGGFDQPSCNLLAHRIDVDSPRPLGVFGFVSVTWTLKMKPVSLSAVNQ